MMIKIPRLPLEGYIDLTYRCNNACRHCWLRIPKNSAKGHDELTYAEIKEIVISARKMGCQAWSISGGEPMLRPDFPEIFDFITQKSVSYKLNTNGTYITHKIAKLLKRPGTCMVALYGATAEVHDHVTKNPGSYEAALRGIAYLKEANTPFTVQIIPMRDNYHQYESMIELAATLSPQYRLGAPWIWLSACQSIEKNREIRQQRLESDDVVKISQPNFMHKVLHENLSDPLIIENSNNDDRIFASCIADRRDFHIDPYGQMSFCCHIKDPQLRYDLRQGTFQEAWDEFIPSLANKVRGGQEYLDNCGACELRKDCRWCGVYGYLEHGRYSAKVDYLCEVAEEVQHQKEDWKMAHLHYYKIAGLTIQLTADFLLDEDTFSQKFNEFQVGSPNNDIISFHLVSSVPTLNDLNFGKIIYNKSPWVIYQNRETYIYRDFLSFDQGRDPNHIVIATHNHERSTISRQKYIFQAKNISSLSFLPTDQILLAPVLANRKACFLHAAGIIIDGQGLLFVGHSEAGKSTILKMLKEYGEILCDDRIIIRKWPEGFRIHGTWSHGELTEISPSDAPLKAIMFLEQAQTNELIPINDKQERIGKFLSHVVKPLATADWWEKIIELTGNVSSEVPLYRLKFDKSGKVIDIINNLL